MNCSKESQWSITLCRYLQSFFIKGRIFFFFFFFIPDVKCSFWSASENSVTIELWGKQKVYLLLAVFVLYIDVDKTIMCKYILVFISCSTVHSTKLTKQPTHLFKEWSKKKMLEVTFDWILRRLPLSDPCVCAAVNSITGPQPSTSTPVVVCRGLSVFGLCSTASFSVGRRLRLCLIMMHLPSVDVKGPWIQVICVFPPLILRTNPKFQLFGLQPQSLFQSPDQGAWIHVSWLFSGLQGLNDSGGVCLATACTAGFRPSGEWVLSFSLESC